MVCGIASNAAQVYRIKMTTAVLSIALSAQNKLKVVNNPVEQPVEHIRSAANAAYIVGYSGFMLACLIVIMRIT